MRTIRIGGASSASPATHRAAPSSTGRQASGSKIAAQLLTSPRRIGGAGVQVNYLQAYEQIPALRTCVDIIANRAVEPAWTLVAPKGAGAKRDMRAHFKGASRVERQRAIWRMRKADELVEVPESIIIDCFLGGTRGLWSGPERRRLEKKYQILCGESFAVIERREANGGVSGPTGQIPVPPNWVLSTPVPGQDWYQVRNRQGQLVRLYDSPGVPLSEVFWRKELRPADPAGRGLGWVRTAATELEVAELTSQHLAQVFYNGARPDLLVIGPWGGQDGAEEQREAWVSDHQGPGRAYLPRFIDTTVLDQRGNPMAGANAQDVQVTELASSLRDLQMSNILEWNASFISQLIGRIPPELRGVTGNSNRATIDNAKYVFDSGTIVPDLERDRVWANEELLSYYPVDGWLWEYESPIEEDREYVRQVMVAMPGAFRVDEHRKQAGYEPLPNGEGEGYLVGLGMSYVKSLQETSSFDLMPDAAATGAAPAEVEVAEPEQEPGGPPVAAAWKRYDPGLHVRKEYRERKPLRPEVYKASVPNNKEVERIAKRMASQAAQIFLSAVRAAQGKVDLGGLQGAIEDGTLSTLLGAWDTDAGSRATVRSLLGLDGLTSGMAKIASLFRQILDQSGQSTARHLGKQLGEAPTWEIGDAEVASWVRDRSKALTQWAEESSVQTARDLLERDAGAEVSAEETAKRLKDHLGLSTRLSSGVDAAGTDPGKVTADRAKAFGGDQAWDSSQEGQRACWRQGKEQGILPEEAERFWVTQRSSTVCPTCYRMDGQRRGIDEPFDSFRDDEDGDGIAETNPIQCMTPGSEVHPECECSVVLTW